MTILKENDKQGVLKKLRSLGWILAVSLNSISGLGSRKRGEKWQWPLSVQVVFGVSKLVSPV
jgi:hypothetical protein